MTLMFGPAHRTLRLGLLGFIIAVSLVPAIAGTMRLEELARGAKVTVDNARFIRAPWPVTLHILAVVPFSILGALQLAPIFRARFPAWHRGVGRLLVLAGVMAALSGLWMTLSYPWPAGDGVAVYVMRLIAGSVMLLSIAISVMAIARRDFETHGRWMLRAYAMGMGAATQVLTHVPWFILVGQPSEGRRSVLMGSAWVINALIAEWLIIASGRRQRQRVQRVSVVVS